MTRWRTFRWYSPDASIYGRGDYRPRLHVLASAAVSVASVFTPRSSNRTCRITASGSPTASRWPNRPPGWVSHPWDQHHLSTAHARRASEGNSQNATRYRASPELTTNHTKRKTPMRKSFAALPEGVEAASSQAYGIPIEWADSLVNLSANDAMTPLRPHSGSLKSRAYPRCADATWG